MGFGGMAGVGGHGDSVIKAMQQAEKSTDRILDAQRETSSEDAVTMLRPELPFRKRMNRKKDLKTRRNRVDRKKEGLSESKTASALKRIESKAEQYERRNPELKQEMLKMLREYIKPGDKKEDILRKVQEFFGDVSLADEALEFLAETSGGELAEEVKNAHEELRENFDREITAGRNISAEARAFAKAGLGTPTGLRDLYRKYTHDRPEPKSFFEELANRFPYKKLRKVIKFLLYSVGSDLRAKGPSIPRGLLHNLMQEVRSLQMILGIYRFFSGRMKLVKNLFAKGGMKVPEQVNFETLSKQFMQVATDRYPSAERILRLARQLDIDDKLLAKIIVFSQLRDAVNEVDAEQIYRNTQHRHEVYAAIIEALEELEDQYEIYEEEEREREGRDRDEDEEKDDDEDRG